MYFNELTGYFGVDNLQDDLYFFVVVYSSQHVGL